MPQTRHFSLPVTYREGIFSTWNDPAKYGLFYHAALVAQGVGLWLGVQTIINIGVNVGMLPTKGLTLPLMSFGGSGLMANVVAIAVLLRVDWENRRMMRGMVR